MARFLAIEWDTHEARIAVAKNRGRDIAVDHAFAVSLLATGGAQTLSEEDIGRRIGEALASRDLNKLDALVAVGRSSIELRLLTMPAAPPEELPDMVRFQAMRQFAAIGEDWPLDFVPLAGGDDEEQISVLAAAIAPKLVSDIRQTCLSAEVTSHRLVLRPFAAASLLRRSTDSTDCRMMVDLLAEEADLTVLADGQVAFMRTVRLPKTDSSEQLARAALGEIRRTIGAAQNQLGGRRVESITVCGNGDDHSAIRDVVSEQLSLPADLFDPFAAVHVATNLRSELPEHRGRFAPLLGMLADELDGSSHAIDFLHPRKKPDPPSRRGRNTGLAIAAGVVAALIAIALFWSLNAKSRKIAALQKEITALKEKNLKDVAPVLKKKGHVDEFLSSDVSWLDELHRVSQLYPNPDDARISTMAMNALPRDGGRIIATVNVRDSDVIGPMEKKLSDSLHVISGNGASYNKENPSHPVRFQQTIIVRRDGSQLRPGIPAETSPSDAVAPKPGGDQGKKSGDDGSKQQDGQQKKNQGDTVNREKTGSSAS